MIHLREEVICQHFESLTRLRAVDQQLTPPDQRAGGRCAICAPSS